MWVERLRLTDFRNYAEPVARVGPEPVVLTGPNGSGKTNLLEAVSLLTAGQGLRRAPYPELARMGAPTGPSLRTMRTPLGSDRHRHRTARAQPTPARAPAASCASTARTSRAPACLPSQSSIFWLTPAMDGLFTGPASERRRFLDRLIPCFDPGYRPRLGQFERAMQQRNRLLAEDVREPSRFAGFERIMAETGVAIAAARAAAVAELAAAIGARRDAAPTSAFPWAELALAGTLETALATRPAVDVEDAYVGIAAAPARARPRRRPHARRPASLRPDRRPRPQGRCRPASAPRASRRRC